MKYLATVFAVLLMIANAFAQVPKSKSSREDLVCDFDKNETILSDKAFDAKWQKKCLETKAALGELGQKGEESEELRKTAEGLRIAIKNAEELRKAIGELQ
jgi:hypothetical protein